jgi:outer membrane putative beta-barrel porin/alpha-amylase
MISSNLRVGAGFRNVRERIPLTSESGETFRVPSNLTRFSLDGSVTAAQYWRVRGHLIILAALSLEAASGAAADEQPICADRPGKATSPCTVPSGHWQIEAGLADWTLQKGGGERDAALVLGETTVKYAVTDRADIEVEFTPWQRVTNGDVGARGIGDLNLIYKQRLTADDSGVQVTALPFVKAPTAKRAFGNGKWEAGLLIPLAWAIGNSPLSIGLTPELDWTADAGGPGHHAAMVQVASLGWQTSDRLNLSAEIWGAWDWDPSGTTKQASADAAAAYLLTNDVQIDAGANIGLNRATPDVELYAGVSKRF